MPINCDLGKILDEIKLGNSFQIFGGLGLLLSVYVNHELGIRIFLLIFIFGGIFRLLNMIKPIFLGYSFKNKFIELCSKIFMRFIIWIAFLLFFAYLINKQINIFIF